MFSLSTDSSDDNGGVIDSIKDGDVGDIQRTQASSSFVSDGEDSDPTQGGKPSMLHKMQSQNADWQRILQKREAAKQMKRQLQEDGVELSDSSDDSCADEGDAGSFSLSSQSEDDNERDDDDVTGNENNNGSFVLTTLQKRGSFSQMIRHNRDGIQRMGLKKRAQGIEDSFVLNTQARRSSILANQGRARTKLQKRIEQRVC